MIEGAIILAIGCLIGWVMGRARRGDRPAIETKKPLCSCRHPRGQHVDAGKGRCNAQVERYNDSTGYDEWVPCPCLTYEGPEPLPEFYSPEIQP